MGDLLSFISIFYNFKSTLRI